MSNEPQNSGSFGLLGASLGGIQAGYIAGVEPRIKASVLLAGAGNISGILAYSDQERASRVRTARMNILRISDPAIYESFMGHFVTQDPLNVATTVPPDSMYLFIVQQDTSVPTVYQRQLAATVPDPRIREVSGPHELGIAEAGTICRGNNYFLIRPDKTLASSW